MPQTKYLCPVCGVPGQSCGDDHVQTLIDSSTIKGEPTMAYQTNTEGADAKPKFELKEYEYMVGHTSVTAMLTKEQAEKLGAVEPGTATSPGTGSVFNNEADRQTTVTREAEDRGVNATHADGTDSEQTAEKSRAARNKRAH